MEISDQILSPVPGCEVGRVDTLCFRQETDCSSPEEFMGPHSEKVKKESGYSSVGEQSDLSDALYVKEEPPDCFSSDEHSGDSDRLYIKEDPEFHIDEEHDFGRSDVLNEEEMEISSHDSEHAHVSTKNELHGNLENFELNPFHTFSFGSISQETNQDNTRSIECHEDKNKTSSDSPSSVDKITVNSTKGTNSLEEENAFSSVVTRVAAIEYHCRGCANKFVSKYSLVRHVFNHLPHVNIPPYVCRLCGRVYAMNSGLQRHLTQHVSGHGHYACCVCHRSFRTNSHLKIHSAIHTGEKPYVCTSCGKAFRQVGHLRIHQLTHTGVKPHVCRICGKLFRQRQHLILHSRTHSGERPFSCNICGRPFADSSSLKKHQITHEPGRRKMRMHQSKRSCSCNECGKSFSNHRSLKNHRLTHKEITKKLGNGSLECSICGALNTSAKLLKGHMLSHSGAKPYACNQCGKSYMHKANLIYHQKTHSEASFSCDECNKLFHSSVSLSKHKRVHAETRKFLCDVCGKLFRQLNTLDSHMRQHTSTPYICTICPKLYKDFISFNRHMSIHKVFEDMLFAKGKTNREVSGAKDDLKVTADSGVLAVESSDSNFSIPVQTHGRFAHKKPFTCPICRKRYRIARRCIVHMRSHTTGGASASFISSSSEAVRVETDLSFETASSSNDANTPTEVASSHLSVRTDLFVSVPETNVSDGNTTTNITTMSTSATITEKDKITTNVVTVTDQINTRMKESVVNTPSLEMGQPLPNDKTDSLQTAVVQNLSAIPVQTPGRFAYKKPFMCPICRKRYRSARMCAVHIRMHTKCGASASFTSSCNSAVRIAIDSSFETAPSSSDANTSTVVGSSHLSVRTDLFANASETNVSDGNIITNTTTMSTITEIGKVTTNAVMVTDQINTKMEESVILNTQCLKVGLPSPNVGTDSIQTDAEVAVEKNLNVTLPQPNHSITVLDDDCSMLAANVSGAVNSTYSSLQLKTVLPDSGTNPNSITDMDISVKLETEESGNSQNLSYSSDAETSHHADISQNIGNHHSVPAAISSEKTLNIEYSGLMDSENILKSNNKSKEETHDEKNLWATVIKGNESQVSRVDFKVLTASTLVSNNNRALTINLVPKLDTGEEEEVKKRFTLPKTDCDQSVSLNITKYHDCHHVDPSIKSDKVTPLVPNTVKRENVTPSEGKDVLIHSVRDKQLLSVSNGGAGNGNLLSLKPELTDSELVSPIANSTKLLMCEKESEITCSTLDVSVPSIDNRKLTSPHSVSDGTLTDSLPSSAEKTGALCPRLHSDASSSLIEKSDINLKIVPDNVSSPSSVTSAVISSIMTVAPILPANSAICEQNTVSLKPKNGAVSKRILVPKKLLPSRNKTSKKMKHTSQTVYLKSEQCGKITTHSRPDSAVVVVRSKKSVPATAGKIQTIAQAVKLYICNVCLKQFINARMYEEHIKTHSIMPIQVQPGLGTVELAPGVFLSVPVLAVTTPVLTPTIVPNHPSIASDTNQLAGPNTYLL